MKARAAIFAGVRKPFEMREYEVPEVEPGAALVKVSLANICGSDLHVLAGREPVSCRYGGRARDDGNDREPWRRAGSRRHGKATQGRRPHSMPILHFLRLLQTLSARPQDCLSEEDPLLGDPGGQTSSLQRGLRRVLLLPSRESNSSRSQMRCVER